MSLNAGNVSDDGVPVITLEVTGREWPAIIDTGFNGDLELPEGLQGKLNDQPAGRLRSALAGG
jgi:predicted aspartyl protease